MSSARAPECSGPVSELKGGPLKDQILEAAKRLGLASHVSVSADSGGFLVTVTFPPHAVTRRISTSTSAQQALSELTVLLIEMARHAGSLGPSQPPQRRNRV